MMIGEGIACPFCGCRDHDVKDSRPNARSIRRRRRCVQCTRRFTTYETPLDGAHLEKAIVLREAIRGMAPRARRAVVELVSLLSGHTEAELVAGVEDTVDELLAARAKRATAEAERSS